MLLSAGSKLGPYEILALIGDGGMGQVWKARDTRLNRTVAIKTSHEQFNERFEREARAIAALNHPHICSLYDVATSPDGLGYLVMEYVDGEPLSGPLPLDEALLLAGQILDALDAAQRQGITHRDLKPGNILVTNGAVKVLDFGLAKIDHAPAAGAKPGATETMPLTSEGAVVGTLPYMSPEQIEGRETSARSDIFAFGVVLDELIAGNGLDTIYDKLSSGAGDERELLKEPGVGHYPTSWSSDGRFLLYNTTNTPKTKDDIWVLPVTEGARGERRPVLLLGTDFNEWAARFSPDMHWIAYVTNETWDREIYVRPFLASGPSGAPALGESKWQITKDGGNFPRWRADGKEIIYDDHPSAFVKTVVEVKARGGVFEFGVPQRLFPGPIDFGAWDVTPDGHRFLSSAPQAQHSALPITLVLNWPALLKK